MGQQVRRPVGGAAPFRAVHVHPTNIAPQRAGQRLLRVLGRILLHALLALFEAQLAEGARLRPLEHSVIDEYAIANGGKAVRTKAVRPSLEFQTLMTRSSAYLSIQLCHPPSNPVRGHWNAVM